MGKPTAPTLTQTAKPGYNRHPHSTTTRVVSEKEWKDFPPLSEATASPLPSASCQWKSYGDPGVRHHQQWHGLPPYCGVTRGPALSSPGRCQLRPQREPEVSPLPIGMSPPNRCQRRSGEPGPFPSLATVRWHQEHGVRRDLPKQKL